MQTLTLGEITFVAEADGVSVELGVSAPRRQRLTAGDAGRLEEFLRRNLPRERRTGYRVRLAPLPDLVRDSFCVRVRRGDRTFQVAAVDLSLTGILVQAEGLPFQAGDELNLELVLGRLACHVSGTVVRLDGTLMAVHFVESLRRGELAPPEGLLAIYRQLEMAWLRTRAGVV